MKNKFKHDRRFRLRDTLTGGFITVKRANRLSPKRVVRERIQHHLGKAQQARHGTERH